ncbi:Retrovirus-related Pol polyprotein like [Argiope bruennichi]|uniref:RNA-directed DNA polymerase n=1 Tax=Argiope bruennichi TaxID=94029 RepID=A0A8T0FY44_ARGBR|nr:Retrovirus-related Pol polyprotein like [Argiope bruennichi]
MVDILVEEAEQDRQAKREEAERQAKREEAEIQVKRKEAERKQALELKKGNWVPENKCNFNIEEKITSTPTVLLTKEILLTPVDLKSVKLGPRKLAAIAEYPVPKIKDELRRFLGLTSFFRRFITRYASVAEPLTRLLKKNFLFICTVDQNEAFEELRSKLISRPALKLFDPKEETEFHTDASSVRLAGRLLQRNKYNNASQLVYCVSRRTIHEEEKYHSSRLKLIAAVWSMTKLRPLLLDLLPTSYEYVKPIKLQRDAQENIRVAQEKMKKNYDKHRCRAQNYNICDVVLVRRLSEQTLLPNSKTQAKYRSPLTIIKVLLLDTYQVTDLRTVGQGRKRQPNYTTTAHASQLKLFHLITEDQDLSDGNRPVLQ